MKDVKENSVGEQTGTVIVNLPIRKSRPVVLKFLWTVALFYV